MSKSSLVLSKVVTFLAGAGAGACFAILIYGAVQGQDTPSWLLPAGIVLAVVGAALQKRLHKIRGDTSTRGPRIAALVRPISHCVPSFGWTAG